LLYETQLYYVTVLTVDGTLAEPGFLKPPVCCTAPQWFRC